MNQQQRYEPKPKWSLQVPVFNWEGGHPSENWTNFFKFLAPCKSPKRATPNNKVGLAYKVCQHLSKFPWFVLNLCRNKWSALV
jgi:hypothetical protein